MKWLVYIGRAVNLFEASFQEVLGHVNTKRIQAREFEAVTNKKNARVLQMESAMVYECMYQDEVQSACWSREVLTFLHLPPFPNHHVKHTPSQHILKIKIITQFLYLLNTCMNFYFHL